LSRFARKTPKNRRLGDFLPCKLPKQPLNRGFCGTKWRKNLQVQQAARLFNTDFQFFASPSANPPTTLLTKQVTYGIVRRIETTLKFRRVLGHFHRENGTWYRLAGVSLKIIAKKRLYYKHSPE
jgi:hypothetical protein